MSDLKNQIESLLFSAGKRLSLEELGRLCHEDNLDAVQTTLQLLQKEIDEKQSSLMLVQEGNGWKLTVREKYIPVVKKVVTTPELPKSILETLAVVAYKAPVMQSQVIKTRTNKAYRHLDELEELGYITREKKGRSKLIKLTPKFFDYFDVPPEKLKEKFKNVAALEQAIETKEELVQQTQQAIVEAAKDRRPQVEIFTDSPPVLAPEIEVIGAKVGELDTYGEAQKPKKKHKHKHAEEAPVTQEEAADILAKKILGEAGIETPEATEEETAGMEEEGALTVEKIKKEARAAKPAKSDYTPTGLFPQGVPPEMEERIEHRVAQILEGDKPEAEESDAAEVPETIPAPPEMTEEEDKASEEPAEEAPAEETAEEPAETPVEGDHEPQPEEEKPKKHKRHH